MAEGDLIRIIAHRVVDNDWSLEVLVRGRTEISHIILYWDDLVRANSDQALSHDRRPSRKLRRWRRLRRMTLKDDIVAMRVLNRPRARRRRDELRADLPNPFLGTM
jgi:hypothetical protein